MTTANYGESPLDAVKPGVAAPACGFAELFERAIALGVPPDATATISYDGAAYAFVTEDGATTALRFGTDCRPLRD
jgi:hypothetical protein